MYIARKTRAKFTNSHTELSIEYEARRFLKKTMSKVKVNSNRTSSALRRDSRGRFVSASPTVSVRVTPKRDAQGRFVSATKTTVKSATKTAVKSMPNRDSNGRFVSATKMSNRKASSFIESMIVDGDKVNVVMSKYPKTVYTYKPTPTGLKAVKNAQDKGGSLGEAYNRHLKGREIFRVIYR